MKTLEYLEGHSSPSFTADLQPMVFIVTIVHRKTWSNQYDDIESNIKCQSTHPSLITVWIVGQQVRQQITKSLVGHLFYVLNRAA